MLPPDHRHVLLDLLRPPAGYELDGAVGTTFTLDLETALVLPLAFASFRIAGSNDPIALMEAVRSASERVDVFCQAGQMAVPRTANGLFAFLEPMVHEVRKPNPRGLFHPKVWYLRYLSDGEAPAVRLLVLTRNLSSDGSWDVGLRLDGTETGAPKADNRPLAELVWALPGMAVQAPSDQRRERINALAESVRRAEWERPEHVTKPPRFWVYGLPGSAPKPNFSGYRHLVVSPFLNDEGLRYVAPTFDTELTVVSRVEDLDRLEWPVDEFEARIVSSAADLADPDADDGEFEDRDRLVGLHAKLYVVERNRAAHVFVGSANATGAAFGANIELLCELTGGATKLGVRAFLDHEDGFGSILEDYTPSVDAADDPEEEALWTLRQTLQEMAEAVWTATVRADSGGFHERIRSSGISLPAGVSVTVELLTLRGTAIHVTSGEDIDGELGPVALDAVTPFVAVTAACRIPGGKDLRQASVMRCRLIDDPAGRLDEILARQVDTPEKFLRFLLLLLGLTDVTLTLGDSSADGSPTGSTWSFGQRSNGIFELLARAVADQPEVLQTLDSLIPRLRASQSGIEVLPPGFDDLWAVIEAARPDLDALRSEVVGP